MAKRILVVDDEPYIVSSLQEVLEGEGYEVTASLDAAPVERLLEDEGVMPDLILLDIRLHEHSGADLAAQLKGHAHTRHLPVILMSAQPQTGALPADGFLPKPFDLRSLLGLIGTYLGTHAGHFAGGM